MNITLETNVREADLWSDSLQDTIAAMTDEFRLTTGTADLASISRRGNDVKVLAMGPYAKRAASH